MIQARGLRFRYSSSEAQALSVDSLEVDGGVNLLFGRTGCGKTTLLRSFNGLVPHYYGGEMGGRVTVGGRDTRDSTPSSLSTSVGTVLQDPESQFLMLSVYEELAFAPRNSGIGEGRVDSVVRELADALGISDLLSSNVSELSSGQKQSVAIASALSAEPAHLLLDEPTSQLDAESARSVFRHLSRLSAGSGTTVIVSEHRIARSADHCSRFIGMEEGAISVDGSVADMRNWYSFRGVSIDKPSTGLRAQGAGGVQLLETTGVGVSYEGREVLSDASMSLSAGEIVALVGRNGSGKTTFLKAVMNFVGKERGKVLLGGTDVSALPSIAIASRVGYLSHNPLTYLFQPSLREEILFSHRYAHSADPPLMGAEEVAASLGLGSKLDDFPRDFSCGERELAALSCLLAGGRHCLLLDEPTRGMDYWRKHSFLALIRKLCAERGVGVLISTHDGSVVSGWADRAYVIEGGVMKEVSPAAAGLV